MGILDIFRPKWKNSNVSIRIEAVQELTDESILTKIALEDKDYEVREIAVQKITDQDALAEIALGDQVWEVINVAIQKITDQDLLLKIALECENGRANIDAATKITSQDAFIKIALECKYYNVREIAVQKITDQDALIKIALEDEEWPVRAVAVEKITDQDTLINIAFGDEYMRVRAVAAEKITDQDTLIRLVLSDVRRDVRLFAVQKITNQDVLTKIALDDDDGRVREIARQERGKAVEKITDQDALLKIALEDEISTARFVAVEKITDQDALIKIALENTDYTVREIATKKITNQDALIKIALEDKKDWVRSSATKKITDQDALIKIALEDKDPHVRLLAVQKITEQDTLIKIASNDKDMRVRKVANKQKMYLQKKGQNPNVELKKSDDQNILSDNLKRKEQEESNSDKTKTKLNIDFFEINAIIEKEIKADFVDGTYILSTGKSMSDVLNIEKAIDNLLNQNLNNPDLLFAKSEVQYASLRQVEGKETREKLLHLYPNHYNANLREKYPDNWTNLFGFPSYSERLDNLPETIYKIWKHNNAMVQIVRNKFNLSLALISQVSDEDFPSSCKVVDHMWKPTWVETPYGGIFVHYLMVKFDDGFVLKREGTINPFSSAPISQKDLLIQRFYNCQSIFLTCVNERKVHFNKKYFLTDKHKTDLKKIIQKINSNKTLSGFDIQSAQNWYWNNVSLDDIKFKH